MKRLAWGTAALLMPTLSLVSCTGGDDDDDAATTLPMTTTGTTDGDDDDSDGDDDDDDDSDGDDDDDDDTTDGGTMDTTAGDDDDDDDDTGGVQCGNGQLDEGEGCDDPNGEDADGCNEDCTVSGAILWEHTQASGLGTDHLRAVTVDDDGNAYVTGQFNNDALGTDLWIRQYTAEGGLGWTVSINGTDGANDDGRDIAWLGDAVYVSGYLDNANNDWRVGQYSLAGAAGWSAGYDSGFGSEVAEAIAVDSAGNVFVAGRTATELASQNVMVRQYLPGGIVGWSATAGGAGDDRALGVTTDPMGNVIAVGYTTGAGRDVWVRKYDPAGGVVWTQTYAGVDGLDDQAEGVATDEMGNIVVVGTEATARVAETVWMRRYDPDGLELWTESYDGQTGEGARAFDVAIDSAGHIVVGGDEMIAGTRDALVRKYDPDATVRWTATYATATDANQFVRGVTIGPGDRIWIAGGLDLGFDGRDAWVARIAQ